jgi:hypothetical protein
MQILHQVSEETGNGRIGVATGLSLARHFVQEGGNISDTLGDNLTHVPRGFQKA